MNIGIYIYDEAEVLDFSGPFEVFSTAKRLGAGRWNVFLVSETLGPVKARGGFTVLPDYSFQNHPQIDLLIVVGGVHRNEMNKSNVLDWVASVDKHAKHIASVWGGISAGIDMSLFLVSKFHSQSHAELVAHQMEYNWQKCT
ncbi:hypothetical protein VCSRO41_3528 [Vibrio cholerae]|nr:hypothetical protein VCSRO41_3528 [Vibrio cholerae]